MNPITKHLSETPPQPWKNGGGVTRELFTWPAQGKWALRISVADIERDGPFSPFPGIDRWFVVLQGSGVLLGDAQSPRKVSTASLPLQFDGGWAPDCSLVDGATRDLNVMIRADAATGWLWRADQLSEDGARYRWQAGDDWAGCAAVVAVFSKQPVRIVRRGAETVELPAYALHAHCYAAEQTPGDWLLEVDDPAQCWLLAVFERN